MRTLKRILIAYAALFGALQATGGLIVNGGFESYSGTLRYTTWGHLSDGASLANWSYGGSVGISLRSDAMWHAANWGWVGWDNATVFLQSCDSKPSYVEQDVHFPVDGCYKSVIGVSKRPNLDNVSVKLTVDGAQICSFWVDYQNPIFMLSWNDIGAGTKKFRITCTNGGSDGAALIDAVSVTLEWAYCSTWDQVKANLEAGNNVKLVADVTHPGDEMADIVKSVTLDLNGHTLTCYGSYTTARPFQVTGGCLTITGSGTINGQDKGAINSDGGSFCWVRSSGKLIMSGGTVKNFKGDGAAIVISINNGGTFEMNGGTIMNCTSTGDGGAVANRHDSLGWVTMNGGTISGCSAAGDGGAIYNAGTFTMNGGTISGCLATHGGVIYNVGTTKIYGGRFTNNTAAGITISNGGFCHEGDSDSCHTYIYGGYFSGNKSNDANLYVGFGYRKSGYLYGGVFAANPTADAESKGCLVLQDSAVVTQVGSNYVVGKNIESDADGKLTGGTYTFNPTNAEYVAAGVVDPAKVSVTGSGTSYTLKATAVDCNTWAQVKANLEAGNDVRLTADFDFPDTRSDNGSCVAAGTHTLDMNGHTITAQGNYRFFYLNNGSLKIVGKGTFNGNGKTYVSNGHFAYVPSGKTLTIDGDVTIKNMKTAPGKDGGAIYIAGGTLVMNAGTISSSTSPANGGAICVANGVLTMTNATIRACSAGSYGGGIYNYNGKLNLVDCAVEDCTSAKGGGGVYNQK